MVEEKVNRLDILKVEDLLMGIMKEQFKKDGMSDEDISDLLGSGQGSMPPVSLDDTELADLLAYLRAEFGG